MSLKILLAAGLTATAGGVAWVASSNTEPEPVVEASPVVAATAPSTPPSPVQPAEAAPTARERTNARAEWAARLARIQAASAEAPRPDRVRADADPQAAGMTWHAAGHEEIELSEHDEHHFCPEGHTCLHGQFTEELMGLVDACKDFMSHMDPEVGLTAHIIGVPDVGTIVESVELSSEGNASEALQECLTETMYTLDLGSTEEAFDRDITIMIGSASAADRESLAGAGVDAKTLAAIEQAMAERGHGRAHTMFIGDER